MISLVSDKEIIVGKIELRAGTTKQTSCPTQQRYVLEFRLPRRTRRTRCLLLLRKPDCIILGDGAHSPSVSVPMHNRVTLRAFPRLINSGFFTLATIAARTKKYFLFVPVCHPLPRRGILFHFSPSTCSRTSGRRLVLEIKGLARQENLYQETH